MNKRRGIVFGSCLLAVALWLKERRRRRERDAKEIEAVFSYWFESKTCDEMQRSVWFARGDRRSIIDDEVREKFGDLIYRLEGGTCAWRWSHQSLRGALSAVIVLDQLARHAWRQEKDYKERTLAASRLAASITRKCIDLDRLSAAQMCFALMPYRHIDDDAGSQILDKIVQRQEREEQENRVLERFRKATERRQIEAVLSTDYDILERPPREPSVKEVDEALLDDPVCMTLKNWMISEAEKRDFTCQFFEKLKNNSNESKPAFCLALVSLSGGVDSMVITRILCDLRDRAKLTLDDKQFSLSLACVHVDYGNRPESAAEASFVQKWCQTRRVRCQVLRMPPELRRKSTDREVYEREARELRFALYHRVLEEELELVVSQSKATAVLLGHHRGDIRENCVSNLMRGVDLMELGGMRLDDILHGTRVARPLLSHLKPDIYRIAERLGVPYFKDTTPQWSTRGKLRNKLWPLLTDIYGEGCGRNLDRLAAQAEELRHVLYTRVLNPGLDAARLTQFGVRLPTANFKNEDSFFWRAVLRESAHRLGLGALSDKAIRIFCQRVAYKPKAGWLELKRSWYAYIDERGVFFLFDPRVFEQYQIPSDPAHEIKPNSRLGNWRFEIGDSEVQSPFHPTSLDTLFESCYIAYDLELKPGQSPVLFNSIAYPSSKKSKKKKFKPRQALDSLTITSKLRDVIPLLVDSPLPQQGQRALEDNNVRRVRVTCKFDPLASQPKDGATSSAVNG